MNISLTGNPFSCSGVSIYKGNTKHLPNIKSAQEYEAEGSMSLGEMNLILLEKVEELTLYILEQQEQIKDLENDMEELKEKGGEK